MAAEWAHCSIFDLAPELRRHTKLMVEWIMAARISEEQGRQGFKVQPYTPDGDPGEMIEVPPELLRGSSFG